MSTQDENESDDALQRTIREALKVDGRSRNYWHLKTKVSLATWCALYQDPWPAGMHYRTIRMAARAAGLPWPPPVDRDHTAS